jgi:subtilisin-like proprotein convertase family protein
VSGSTRYGVYGSNDTLWVFISDLELATDMIEVTIPEKVLLAYTLVEVEITIDTVLHPSVSDLEFYLTHSGVTDTLIFQSSCNGENFYRTTLSDQGYNSISSGTAPYTGIYAPDQPLSLFAGMDPNGQWILGIYDGVLGNTGQFKGWSLTLYFETPVNVDNEPVEIIQDFELHQNYPNPFNPSTTIKWQMPESGNVTLKIYDVLGREVITLVNEELSAGKHDVTFDASQFSSGVYFYQLKAGDFIEIKKMILIK